MIDPMSKAAYVIASAAAASIQAQGMSAENAQRAVLGQSMAYTEADFERLINQYGLHPNALIGFLE